MKRKNIPDEAMEAILNSLDGIQRAEPAPFFYTRLRAKMDTNVTRPGIAGIAWLRPSLAFPVLAFLVIMNLFTIFHKNKESGQQSNTNNKSLVQQVAQDYDLSIFTY